MIHKGTKLKVADNSGALEVEMFGTYGGSRVRSCKPGDIIKVAIKKVVPNGKIKKGSVYKARIMRTKYKVQCFDGGYGWAGDNACILVDGSHNPIGTRIMGFVARISYQNRTEDMKKTASMCEWGY